jgi:nucleoside-diphosphate-sugar epimerase
MRSKKNIGIIGCGWLGKPLSYELSDDFNVECFSREKTTDSSAFWQNDTIIIAIHTKDNYLATLQKIVTLTKPECNLIFMSSTSVYKEFDSDVDECAEITKTSLIKEAEELVSASKENVLVLRLGGLMGEDRVAGRWKNATDFSDGFVNYIHRDDVINIVKKMLKKGLTKGTYNLVAPEHPTRLEIHTKNSQKFGSEIGNFRGFSNRRVSSKKLIEDLNYTFLHSNPLDFWS